MNTKPYETAARIYCAKMGWDPDESIQLPHPTIVGHEIEVPRWELAAEELIEFSAKLSSLKEAFEQPKTH